MSSRVWLMLPKEKPGCWTRQTAFEQVRHGSNIQLLSFSLVTACSQEHPRADEPGQHWPGRETTKLLLRRTALDSRLRSIPTGEPSMPARTQPRPHPVDGASCLNARADSRVSSVIREGLVLSRALRVV
jgi:hypothetical protein